VAVLEAVSLAPAGTPWCGSAAPDGVDFATFPDRLAASGGSLNGQGGYLPRAGLWAYAVSIITKPARFVQMRFLRLDKKGRQMPLCLRFVRGKA